MTPDENDYDDLTSSFATLATLEVPRDLDLAAITAGGRRRVVRRRWIASGTVVGGAALATAAIAALSGIPGATGTQPGVAGGPSAVITTPPPLSRPTPPTSRPPSTTPKPGGPADGPGGDPMQRWTQEWEQALVALKVPINTTHGSGSDSTSTESQTSVIRGKATGYVAMTGTIDQQKVTAARGTTSCPILLYPVDGAGVQCKRHSDAQGNYWVKTYTDSYQGRTTIVQVATDTVAVTLSQSQGYPDHQIFWDESTKNVLPWDGRDPISENGPFRKHPALDAMPLTLEQQVSLARSLVTGR